MPASQQTAIRVGDEILHSESLADGIEGILIGAAVGLVIGAVLVAGEVATGGALTIFAVALLAGGAGGKLGKVIGKDTTNPKGKVLTGSPNVFVGNGEGMAQPAARAKADVAHCEEHSDSDSAHDQPSARGKKIAQGSATVLINGFYAARQGDKGVCDFTLGNGSKNVFIGGPAKTADGLTITSETSSIDGLITGMMVVGGIILAAPAVAGIVADCAGLGMRVLAQQLAARLLPQFAIGIGLSQGFKYGAGYAVEKTGNLLGKNWGPGSVQHDAAMDIAEDLGPFAGGFNIPGAGKSLYGLADSVPALFGLKSVTAGAASGVSAATGTADADATGTAADASGADASGADASAAQRYGGTGADSEITSTPAKQEAAHAAYDQIRANPDDVAQVAQNTGYPEDVVVRAKEHLFNSRHDIFNPETGETTTGNFVPNQDFADLWNKAANGTLGKGANPWDPPKPMETSSFQDLIRHEYVESHLTADGIPYQSPDAWVQDANGKWEYDPKPGSFGAHELSPRAGADPFGHYPSRTGLDPSGIPNPNENLSNIDNVVSAIRRTLGGEEGPKGGPAGGGEPGGPGSGPKGGGASGRAPPPRKSRLFRPSPCRPIRRKAAPPRRSPTPPR